MHEEDDRIDEAIEELIEGCKEYDEEDLANVLCAFLKSKKNRSTNAFVKHCQTFFNKSRKKPKRISKSRRRNG